jgi:hypothetical protein
MQTRKPIQREREIQYIYNYIFNYIYIVIYIYIPKWDQVGLFKSGPGSGIRTESGRPAVRDTWRPPASRCNARRCCEGRWSQVPFGAKMDGTRYGVIYGVPNYEWISPKWFPNHRSLIEMGIYQTRKIQLYIQWMVSQVQYVNPFNWCSNFRNSSKLIQIDRISMAYISYEPRTYSTPNWILFASSFAAQVSATWQWCIGCRPRPCRAGSVSVPCGFLDCVGDVGGNCLG